MNVTVKKLTGVDLLRRANSFTTGHESHMELAKAYSLGHSPIRTQFFWVELTEIPLFVASQFVRSHVGIQFFQRSKRTDRGGEDFNDVCRNIAFEVGTCWIASEGTIPNSEKALEVSHKMSEVIERLPERFDRWAPTDLAFICNAEALINMAHKRLCAKASQETRNIFQAICCAISSSDVDPALADHLVRQCVYRGGICPEAKCCGWINSEVGQKCLERYKELFK